jgi:hypothetical protein
MYIVYKLDEMFCRHQLGPFDLLYILDLGFLYWYSNWEYTISWFRENSFDGAPNFN